MLWFGLIWFVKFAEKGFDDMIVWNVVCFHLYLIFVVVFSTYPTGEIGDKYQICIHPYLIFVVYSPQMSDRWKRWQISGLHPPLAATNRSGQNTKKSTSYPPLYMLSHLIPIGECGLIQTRVHWSVLRMLQWQWPLGESPYLSTSDITASFIDLLF